MTFRLKLTMGVICAILVANALLMLVVVVYLERVWLNEVQTRVRLDLNSARAAYQDQIQGIATFLRAAALDRGFAGAAARGEQDSLRAMAARLRASGSMDFVDVLDARGRVLVRSDSGNASGDSLAENPLVAKALSSLRPASGTILLSPAELEREGPALAARARMPLVSTPSARPTKDEARGDGLVAAAAVPLVDEQDRLAGVLYAGTLLNRRYEIVDAIREQVFPPHSPPNGDPQGNVTFFLGDLRIATNVLAPDGSRAVGTRLSAEVNEAVLGQGRIWSAPAQVLTDWYITAYEPIRDPKGRVVGALYVGLSKAPLDAKRNRVIGVVVATVLAASLAALLLAFTTMQFVLRPVDRLIAMARRVVQGDLSARVGLRPPGEIGTLCRAIDQMADAVAERENQLKQATRQQIGRSEKLASLGRLAAGVAHEINNPLTGVLTFAHLMREKPNMDDQDRQDLDLMIHETTRAAEIVRGLLDFARERAANKEALCVNDVVRKTVRLIRNQKSFDRITIEEKLDDGLPQVEGDLNQLQQVMLNLALNACEAMPKGGTLTIASRVDGGRVFIHIADTGTGIKREHYDQVFEPFFTTKPVGKGTGLGLSVSYGIVRQHGGNLEFESEEGRGTTFTVTLPALGEPAEDEG